MSNPHRSEEEITTILMALVAWAGQPLAASRWLKAEKDIGIAPDTLKTWKVRYGDRYDELREKYAGQLEGNLVNEMREIARLSLETERLAIEKARDALEKGEDRDPGRTAANLSRVTQSSVDKVLSLSGRPTQITETRDATEILRSLIAKGILKAPEEPKEIAA